MSTTELTCQELVELVTAYLEGVLSPEEVARFERHLTICPGCVTYVEQFRETIALTGTLREEDVPPAARAALLEQFADWKREHVGRNSE
jgi:anti-sigma factor RsiW